MTQKKWRWYYSREAILNEDASISWADHDAKNGQNQTAEDFLANGPPPRFYEPSVEIVAEIESAVLIRLKQLAQ